MDIAELINKINHAVPGAVLEKTRFGRTSRTAVWIEARALPEVAAFLHSGGGPALDWLENLSVMQMDETLVATYFLRSSQKPDRELIVRVSVAIPGLNRDVVFPSVSSTWPMARAFEVEAGELFGIRFNDRQGARTHQPYQLLPEGWTGFPLRKTYMFPTEFLGIAHSRKAPVERQ